MEQIQLFVQDAVKFYKKNELQSTVVLKFMAGLFVFWRISTLAQGQMSTPKLVILILFCAFLTTIVSPAIFLLLCSLAVCLFISVISIETACVALLFFFFIFVFYARLFPTEGLIIPIMLVAYFFKVPYIVPIFAGIYIGGKSIVPVAAAVFIHYNTYLIDGMAKLAPKASFTPLGAVDSITSIYQYLSQSMAASKGWFFVAVVIVISVIAGLVISNVFINYEKEAAIVASGIIILFGLIICKLLSLIGISLLGVILGTLISCAVVYIGTMADFILDYNSAQRIKFQDENYYYYVKAVPKISFNNKAIKK